MNRRSFLAALPLVPAALVALRAARREPLIFGTVWKDGKWISGYGGPDTWSEAREWCRRETDRLTDLYDELIAETPRDTGYVRNRWSVG